MMEGRFGALGVGAGKMVVGGFGSLIVGVVG